MFRPQLLKSWIALSTGKISIQWITQLVSLALFQWIVIYPLDSAIQLWPIGARQVTTAGSNARRALLVSWGTCPGLLVFARPNNLLPLNPVCDIRAPVLRVLSTNLTPPPGFFLCVCLCFFVFTAILESDLHQKFSVLKLKNCKHVIYLDLWLCHTFKKVLFSVSNLCLSDLRTSINLLVLSIAFTSIKPTSSRSCREISREKRFNNNNNNNNNKNNL